MLFEKTTEELNAWKTQMKGYEKAKRTKKPFGKSVTKTQFVTYEDVKNKEVRFNPVLQKFKADEDEILRNQKDEYNRAKSLIAHLKQKGKYDRNYDIVNLHGNAQQKNANSTCKLGPIRNAYNVINNQKLPDFYFKNRQLQLPIERGMTLLNNNQKQYNIVTGIFKENHQQKIKEQENKQKNMIMNKYWTTHNYDPVFGKFYNVDKEEEYQKERKKEEVNHGKNYDNRFPPSYVMREPFLPDPTKPLPESLQTLDEMRQNAKKRYKMKYCLEDEYNRRNLEEQEKHQKVIVNKVHEGRVNDLKMKEFNIVTMKKYPQGHAQKLFHKEGMKSTWQKLNSTTGKIKTGGFSQQ